MTVGQSISEAEWEDRMWWCMLLVLKGGKDVFSVTIQGIPHVDYIEDLIRHFGEYVIFEPPWVIDRTTGGLFNES